MRLLITAGPTHEPIDPVRYIGNRSSGKLGTALARAAVDQGHEVTLLLGPVRNPPPLPDAVRVVPFLSTQDLQDALNREFQECEVLVMAAAVADYRPAVVATEKLKRKSEGTLSIELEPTPDVVGSLTGSRQPGQKIIAFALEEPAALIPRATEKMQRKGVDAIVANPLKTMDADTIEPTWLTRGGVQEPGGEMSKTDFADWLLSRIEKL